MTQVHQIQWPDGRYTAWRDASHEDVFHASAPGLNGVARCGAVVDLPLCAPTVQAAGVSVAIPFLLASRKPPRYPGDDASRHACESCLDFQFKA